MEDTRAQAFTKTHQFRNPLDDILSVPPSYHTDEEHRRGYHRSAMNDRRGNVGAFALEDAFERRLRNTLQRRRPRFQHEDSTSFSSPFRGVPTPFAPNQQSPRSKYPSDYPEHRVRFESQQELVRDEFTQGYSPSYLPGHVKGITRF